MEHYELRVLGDFFRDASVLGTQAVDTWWKPTPTVGLSELESHEVAEVVFAEIFSPVTGAGVAESLKKIIFVLDGKDISNYVSLSGIRDSVMMAPKSRIWGAQLLAFGAPMSNDPLKSTTLKYVDDITIECLAGVAITQDYRVRLWGYVYKAAELPTVFGATIPNPTIHDWARGRILPIAKPSILVTEDTWGTLSGGKDQALPKIMPFMRYAYNAAVTDAKSGEYEFRYQTAKVGDSDENLYFEFLAKDALWVKGLGVRAPANLDYTYLKIAGDNHPKGRFPTRQLNNPIHFGWAYPMFPSDIPLYYRVPKLDIPLLVWNEKGYVVCQDDGTQIAINGIIVALTGIRVEMAG